MINLCEFLIDQCSNRIDEAFKQEDFYKAYSLIDQIFKKEKLGVYPGVVPMKVDNKVVTSMICIGDATDTVVAINFYDGGDSMAPNSITVVDGGKAFIYGLVDNDGRYSKKGVNYDCTGVGITAILKVVVGILKQGAKNADQAIAQYADYFSMMESQITEVENIITEGKLAYDQEAEIMQKIADMENAGKTGKQIGDVLYRMAGDAKRAGNKDYFNKWNDLRTQYINGTANTEQAGVTDVTNQPAARVPVAKEVTIKQVKVGQAKATADFWAQNVMRDSASARMKNMERSIMAFTKNDDFKLAIFAGAPGVGKTFNVNKVLTHEMGPVAATALDGKWGLISGSVSPKEFYKMLFKFRNPENILVIDDGDAFLDDKEATDLFKAATNGTQYRQIGWGKNNNDKLSYDEFVVYEDYCDQLEADPHCKIKPERAVVVREEGVGKNGTPVQGIYLFPKSFIFQGRIIILTNRGFSEFEDAILDRAVIKDDFDFTDEEMLELVRNIAPHVKTSGGRDIDPDVMNWTLNFIDEWLAKIADFNKGKAEQDQARLTVSIRSYQKAAELAQTYWNIGEDIVQYNVINYFKGKAGGASHK